MLLRTSITALSDFFFFLASYQTIAALKILKWLNLEFEQATKPKSFIKKHITYLSWSILGAPAPKPGSMAQLHQGSVLGQNPN